MELGDKEKLEMVLIPAGEFLMGSRDSDKDALDEEKPRHRVRLSKPFYMGKYLVTQAQWLAVTGDKPSFSKGRNSRWTRSVGLIRDNCRRFQAATLTLMCLGWASACLSSNFAHRHRTWRRSTPCQRWRAA